MDGRTGFVYGVSKKELNFYGQESITGTGDP